MSYEGKLIIAIHGMHLGFTRYVVEKETPKLLKLMPVHKTSMTMHRQIYKSGLNYCDWIRGSFFDDMDKMLAWSEELHKRAAQRWEDNQRAITDIRKLHSELRS